MRWDRGNTDSVMALAGAYQSGPWHTCWKSERLAG